MVVHPVKLCLFAVIIIAVKYCHVIYVPAEPSITSADGETKKESQPKENRSISSYWGSDAWKMCHDPDNYFRSTPDLYSVRLRHFITPLDVEIRGYNPLAVRIVNVIGKSTLDRIEQRFLEDQPEEATVFENGTSIVQSSRIADTLWVPNEDILAITLRRRLSQFTTINFKNAEQPLIMSYQPGGHYAAHHDCFFPPDYWHATMGGRVATALIIVKKAEKGGGTVFPNHRTVVQPNPGDVILWFNLNSNGEQENDSLHGGCPIIKGQKMAVSFWIRDKYQYDLTSPISGKSYRMENLFGW
uniref:Fe2OG dioxygenase domain-containing protein n=1 Tax=Panagrellus redivivus TaxID=6233 RepID=A0A7E4UX56_PANRE